MGFFFYLASQLSSFFIKSL